MVDGRFEVAALSSGSDRFVLFRQDETIHEAPGTLGTEVQLTARDVELSVVGAVDDDGG